MSNPIHAMPDPFASPYPNSLAVVPARMASTRLPGKMLADLGGKPLVVRTWEACCATRLFERVLVATDHPDILRVVEDAGGEGMMTDPRHNSGSDRLAEVAMRVEADLYVNVQGDEPFVTRASLQPLMALFADANVRVGSLMSRLHSVEEYMNPSVVKVLCNHLGDALYFSRAPIPLARGGGLPAEVHRHIGVYAFRRDVLLAFNRLAPSPAEQTEMLEQLRLLHWGYSVRIACVDPPEAGIDTPEDLIRARLRFE
ncbi:MAG: 3-deoxy-manno-octulosonate cytidylyltransferase [Sphingomonadales bacterium]|nr:3-deoxy-manno-octulosonate cytidylyltransferase [Sphingomonadales bacterium]